MAREKDRIIRLPVMCVFEIESVLENIAKTLRHLPGSPSRRITRVEAQMWILRFPGKIYLSNGYPYPRRQVDSVLGDADGRQISIIYERKTDGTLRHKASSITFPRLLALYLYIAIRWPYLAKEILA